MIPLTKACEIAQLYVSSLGEQERKELKMLEEHIEFTHGWVFFYNSKIFVETGNRSQKLFGNAPIIVDKLTGKVSITGTAYPIEHYIENYRPDHG